MANVSPDKPDHTAISVSGPPSAATRLKPLKGEGDAEIPTINTETKEANGVAAKYQPKGPVSAGLAKFKDLLDQLSTVEIEELRGAFDQHDTDHSGFLNMSELGNVLNTLGSELTGEEFADFARMVDQDKDNKIDFEEFLIMMAMKLTYPFAQDEIARAFEVFDEDHNGLDLAELQKEMKLSLEDDPTNAELIKEFEQEAKKFTDHDTGKVRYHEFAAHLLSAKTIPDGHI